MSAKPGSRITRKSPGLVTMQIFDLHLTKEIRNKQMKNKKKKMKLQHMPKIKELTNLYIPEMT